MNSSLLFCQQTDIRRGWPNAGPASQVLLGRAGRALYVQQLALSSLAGGGRRRFMRRFVHGGDGTLFRICAETKVQVGKPSSITSS